ncbi:YL1-domain-containing protein [Pseudovirgaria hyperparasitica]|uniref:YL1-domain-containing protein n=1 Tax=Pseudovirgaria hyperparasitica TaxID=470096 RepID=A0A6A6WNG2_9PEZI|nr:YL1-domain-containing protein [Pseudovirgaria hyperparasitica]KAF2763562.1 YL1-domain-containing protein [Pseudovirgaria hyperparasitica]
MSTQEQDEECQTLSHDESDGSETEDAAEPAMVLLRARRSNAGNRMSNLLALAEAEDDETRVIYGDESWQETADDMEFGGAEAEAPDDVSLESSSDDNDEDDQEDDEAGEKELKRQERTEKTKKRKQIANPFADAARKKAKLNAAPKVFMHAPRPKKKSERDSWLPTPDEGPVRASSRKQTMKNKKDTHARLILKEKTRERVVELMQAANRRKEAFKPLSQEEKLRMAARIEKENSKSLNRWEESENRRAAEQQARLDALRNRKIDGPYIRYWSGPAIWQDDKLVATGKKARLVQELDGTGESLSVQKVEAKEASKVVILPDVPLLPPHSTEQVDRQLLLRTHRADGVQYSQSTPSQIADTQSIQVDGDTPGISTSVQATVQVTEEICVPQQTSEVKETRESETSQAQTRHHTETAPEPKLARPSSSEQVIEQPNNSLLETDESCSRKAETPPVLDTEMSNTEPLSTTTDEPTIPMPTTIMFAPPGANNGFLDGILDWASLHNQNNSVPDPAFSAAAQPPPPASQPIRNTQQSQDPTTSIQPPGTTVLPSAVVIPPIHVHTPTTLPPVIRRATRNLIMLSHYETLMPSQKEHIYKILLAPQAKPSRYLTKRVDKNFYPPTIMCAVTAQIARYRDPVTGLAYRDKNAYRRIKRLVGGSFAWSAALEAFVGGRGDRARGVPERFWNAAYEKPKAKKADEAKPDIPMEGIALKREEGIVAT